MSLIDKLKQVQKYLYAISDKETGGYKAIGNAIKQLESMPTRAEWDEFIKYHRFGIENKDMDFIFIQHLTEFLDKHNVNSDPSIEDKKSLMSETGE